VYSLPFTLRSYAEVDYVRGKMDAAMLEGLKKNGFVSFGLTDNGFAYLMSNHPVARPEDLKGQQGLVAEATRSARRRSPRSVSRRSRCG